MVEKNETKKFVILHAILALGVILFSLYRRLMLRVTLPFPGCIFHDCLFLYCPLCGGTRAVAAFLRGDLLLAFRSNAFVALVLALLLILDVVAFIRLLRKKNPFFRMPVWVWWGGALLLLLYFVLRNVLMIAYGYDPTGDLGWFWS